MFPLFLITMAPTIWAGQMTLCDYFKKLGVNRPECQPISLPQYGSFRQYGTQYEDKGLNSIAPVETFSALPLCTKYFHSCMSSKSCESGTVCISGSSATSCCTDPSLKTCPSPDALNVHCRNSRGVSWCSNDYDCRGSSTMPAKCCPSGCNYNMCVHLGVPQTVPRQRRFPIAFSKYMNEEENCPDPYTLQMSCKMRRPVNWCLSDAECPSRNSLQPRKCCTTICGYNACLVKYNGKWVVG